MIRSPIIFVNWCLSRKVTYFQENKREKTSLVLLMLLQLLFYHFVCCIASQIPPPPQPNHQGSISPTFFASFFCTNVLFSSYVSALAPKFCKKNARLKCWWNRQQGSILPTCLHTALKCADPKSTKKTVMLLVFFCAFAICAHNSFA